MFKQSRILVFIFFAISSFMITSAIWELNQSRKELRSLMEDQSRSLLKVLIQSANISLKTLDFLENETTSKSESVLDIKKELGFGKLCRRTVKRSSGIIYIALQDTFGIMAASHNISKLESISSSKFLKNSYFKNRYSFRIFPFKSTEVFEAVAPLTYNERKIGLFRLGLSIAPLKDIDRRIKRRLFIISIILIILGTLIFYFIFTRYRLSLLSGKFKTMETYSGNIIEHASDSIIVLSEKNGINIFNKSAQELFGISSKKAIGKQINDIAVLSDCCDILETDKTLSSKECKINGENRYLYISNNSFIDYSNHKNHLLLIRDLSELKTLEEELERSKHLSAMGKLSSGIAHEIRNPLNAISTIIQQLAKDFRPKDQEEEYKELTTIVRNEINRIDKTVQDFLYFAKPESLLRSNFSFGNLLGEIEKQFSKNLLEKSINLKVVKTNLEDVNLDRDKIKQIIINLILNAADAIKSSGIIKISVNNIENKTIELIVSDNGTGINENILPNIFNLYFTTKAKGTGIGLSMVQKIIHSHGGTIKIENNEDKGSIATIQLPVI